MSREMVLTEADLNAVIDEYHAATAEFITGDPKRYKRLFSNGPDVTLGNPFGPFGQGRGQIDSIMERASALYRDGEITSFETVSKLVTSNLAYIVQVERFTVKIAGSDQPTPVALRTTSVFRPEDGAWRIVHRHADPITSARPPESVIQK